MKKIIYIVYFAITIVVSCKSPEADKAKTEDQKEVTVSEGISYKIDTTQIIRFIGTQPVGEHKGSFGVHEGNLMVKSGNTVIGGKIILNISSLKITDNDTSGISKLRVHLLSPDFFNTTKFPTAVFEITSVTAFKQDSSQNLVLNGATHTISGNLILKGISKNISFPAILDVSGTAVMAKANFNIDRTNWGLSYGNDQSLGNKFIRPEVNINFELIAIK